MYEGKTDNITIETKIGNEVQLSIPTKEGYTFKEWTIISGEADINENKVTPRTNLVKLSATYEESIICGEFVSDPWKTIAECVRNRSGDSAPYNVGDEKEVAINGTNYTVRIANNSNYNCSLDSKTACGFVVEFVDIIIGYNMNPPGTYNDTEYPYGTNLGGWPGSAMYKYLNGDTANHLTYESTNATIYSKLPSDLQNVIIDTYVVSGHGSADTGTRSDGNFESTDKLYLLTTGEVWSDCLTSNCNDTASYPYSGSGGTTTRQLDYYQSIGVSKSNYSGAIKQKNSSNSLWWLRASGPFNSTSFRYVEPDGNYSYNFNAYDSIGVAPAFRIG